MKKLVIASVLLISSVGFFINAMEDSSFMKIKQSSVTASQSLGNIEVFHDKDGFHVMKDDECHHVKSYFVDSLLRKADKKTLKKFQKVGYLLVKQMDDGEFSLSAKTRGLGGGPVTGAVLYWLTKTLCYGTAVAAVGSAVAASGGCVATMVAGVETASMAAFAVGLAIPFLP